MHYTVWARSQTGYQRTCTPSLEASHCNESWALLRYELAKTSCLGRPRKTWIQQIGDGTTTSWKQMWQSAEERGHRGESSQRTTAVYASWWWWWFCIVARLFCFIHLLWISYFSSAFNGMTLKSVQCAVSAVKKLPTHSLSTILLLLLL